MRCEITEHFAHVHLIQYCALCVYFCPRNSVIQMTNSLTTGIGSDQKKKHSYFYDVFKPLLNGAYVRAMSVRYGKNVKDWSLVGREEFGSYAPFSLPEGCDLLAEFQGPPKLLPPEAKYGKSLSMGMLVECDDAYYAVFRGTIALYEWYYDLKFFCVSNPEADKEVKVHGGFWEIYSFLRLQIKEAKQLMNKEKPLRMCGHSLGGVLALFAAVDWEQFSPELFTLATPKPGNAAFADFVNQKNFRYVRYELKGDPVPLLPPLDGTFLKQDFAHAGEAVLLYPYQGKNLKERMVKAVKAHLPSSYFEALDLWMRKREV